MSYQLYPLVSSSGTAIPLDILAAVEHVGVAISNSALVSPVQITAQDINLHMVFAYCNVDAVLSFDEVTPVSDFAAGQHFIPAYRMVPLVLGSQYISAITESVAATLHLNIVKLWDTLETELTNTTG